MTNEEKAIIIANLNEQPHDGRDDWSYDECFRSALEMSEWKDQQFKEYLYKKRKKYTNGLSIALQKNAIQEAIVNDKIQCLLNEIINELFGE